MVVSVVDSGRGRVGGQNAVSLYAMSVVIYLVPLLSCFVRHLVKGRPLPVCVVVVVAVAFVLADTLVTGGVAEEDEPVPVPFPGLVECIWFNFIVFSFLAAVFVMLTSSSSEDDGTPCAVMRSLCA